MMKTVTKFLLWAAAATAAYSSPLTVTFETANQVASPGAVVTFRANAVNTTSDDLNLNSNSSTIDAPLMLDDTLFLSNWFVVLAMSSFDPAPQPLFEIKVPVSTPAGLYKGVFTILGGPDLSDQNVLGQAEFSVQVDGVVVVPEPASAAMVAMAGCALIAMRRAARDRMRA